VATQTSPGGRGGLFLKKPIASLVGGDSDSGLRRSVGVLDLTALGLGAIIGVGIFVVICVAIGDSGPAIVVSFVLAGVTCMFSALAFAELASTIPVSGSAYTYAYATLGEFVAFIIGWDLVLEYGVSIAAVAVGWGAYLNELLESVLSFSLPDAISLPRDEGGTVNLTAAVLVFFVSSVLMIGVKESVRTNTIMVVVKLVVLLLFIGLGVTAFKAENFTPFFSEGVGGSISAAAVIFFAYIGFDAISTSGEEVKKPARDLPIAIIGSLAVATLLYILVAAVATGALPFDKLKGEDAPLALALSEGAGFGWAANVISLGALIAITSVVLTLLYGQTRILFAMSRDGLLSKRLAKLNARTRTPLLLTGLLGLFFATLAAIAPLSSLVELVNIGTLFAFIIVNVGVIVLRRTNPDLERGYRVPFVPVFPIVGSLLCIGLMTTLPLATFIRFFAWMAIGIVIYFLYSRRHSLLRHGETATNPDAELG